MNPDKIPNLDKARLPHAYIVFGERGHEKEYIFKIQANKYSESQDIPCEWEEKILEFLGEGWSVMNRNARIEIVPPNLTRTPETDSKVTEIIKSLISEDCELFNINK